MSNKAKPDNHGHVPMHVINQLNEHTAGGFLLFYFNSENGSPEQIMTFDSPAHCLALRKHIEDWSKAVHELSVESEKANLISYHTEDAGSDDDVI
jgi:hypothetical protein